MLLASFTYFVVRVHCSVLSERRLKYDLMSIPSAHAVNKGSPYIDLGTFPLLLHAAAL